MEKAHRQLFLQMRFFLELANILQGSLLLDCLIAGILAA